MSKEELLDSIRPDMQLTKGFLLRVFGYSVTDQHFAEIALTHLEAAGCSRAREYFAAVRAEWMAEHEAILDRVSDWYCNQLEEEEHNKEDGIWTKDVDSMTEAEAKELLKKMIHCYGD